MKVGPGTADFLLLFAGIVLPGALIAGEINTRLNKSMGWDQKELNTLFVQFFTFFLSPTHSEAPFVGDKSLCTALTLYIYFQW